MTRPSRKPVIGLVMGDAAGIAPELIIKAFENEALTSTCSPFVIGNTSIMKLAASTMGRRLDFCPLKSVADIQPHATAIPILEGGIDNPNFKWGVVDSINGRNAVSYIEKGVDLGMRKEIDGMVIAPLNKESMHKGGMQFPDEIAFLGHLVKTRVRTVIKWGKVFRSTVVGHVRFSKIAEMVTKANIVPVIDNLNNVIRQFGIDSPRIAVAALNPHGGEDGTFGDEEIREIAPAVESVKATGVQVSGPFPADTVFVRAIKGQFDGVVFLYHDQGNIAMKSAAFGEGVLIYTGVPFPCASVVHGCAYGKAGQNRADSTSFEDTVMTIAQMAVRQMDGGND